MTCVSVLEHIPGDVAAVRTMWSLVKPGGVLLLTLPCMSQASEQYIDYDEYGFCWRRRTRQGSFSGSGFMTPISWRKEFSALSAGP